MMTCQTVREQLSLYLYEELASTARAEFEAHLKECAACTRALAEEERLHAFLREQPLREPSPELLVECRAALEEKLAEEAVSWRGVLRAWFGGLPVPATSRALALLTLLAVGFGAGWTLRPRSEPGAGAPRPAATTPWAGADLSGMRIAGIRQVNADPQTGTVRLMLDAERRLALEGTLEDPHIQRILIYTMKNYENPGIRRESLEVLRARPNDPQIHEALVHALLNDRNPGLRLEALNALSGLEWNAPVRQAVIQVLEQDSNAGIRVTAINLLAEHADESVVPVLRELAQKDRNPYVRSKCASALRNISGEY